MTRRWITLTCEDCQKRFERRSDQATRASDGVIRCAPCSRRARASGRAYPARRTGREVDCDTCGRSFYKTGSELRRTSGDFCSPACLYAARRDQERPEMQGRSMNAGPSNGRFKTGKYVGQRTQPTQKRKTRQVVKGRDGDRCLLCGRIGPGLHLHRVVYGSQGGTYVPENCVLLCASDHTRVHRSKREWFPFLRAHLARAESRRLDAGGGSVPAATPTEGAGNGT